MKDRLREFRRMALAAASGFLLALPAAAQGPSQPPPAASQRVFASPKEAVEALRAAARAGDKAALAEIFGPEYRRLLSGDDARDSADLSRFCAEASSKLALARQGSDEIVIEVGEKRWPFPVPIVNKGNGWYFDTYSGEEEVIDRRIGKNELDAIGVCRAYARGYFRRIPLPAKPVHGYYFRTLAESALLAYPEAWGQSGIMTFLVGRGGLVYSRNLGENTAQAAAAMTQFHPGKQWQVEKEPGTPILLRGAQGRAGAKPGRGG